MADRVLITGGRGFIASWLVRGLLFEYLGLMTLSAYQTQYRRFVEPGDRPGSAPRLWVHHA